MKQLKNHGEAFLKAAIKIFALYSIERHNLDVFGEADFASSIVISLLKIHFERGC